MNTRRFNIIYFLLIFFFSILILTIYITDHKKNENLIEASWLNYNCMGGPWAFCSKFEKIYKMKKNIETTFFRRPMFETTYGILKHAKPEIFQKFNNPMGEKIKGKSPFPYDCVSYEVPYCKKSGYNVFLSLPTSVSAHLNDIIVKTKTPFLKENTILKKECYVSDLVNFDIAKKNLKKNNLDCKILNSEKATRYNNCAWKEDRQLIVIKKSREEALILDHVELDMNNSKFDYDITDCFK